MEAAKAMRFDTKVAYGMRMMPEARLHAQRRESANTTLDGEKSINQSINHLFISQLTIRNRCTRYIHD